MTQSGKKQLSEWQGEFGDAYIGRNAVTSEGIQQRVKAYAKIFSAMMGEEPGSILEVGANIGLNLRALRFICAAEMHGLEPNDKARKILVEEGVVDADKAYAATAAAIPLKDGAVELAFTSTVLIHVPDETLDQSLTEIHRVSSKYILSVEYFSPNSQTIPYRGHDDLLFKRDYGSIWMDRFPDLELVDYGFFWKRVATLDNVNWWLLRKK